MLSNTPSPQQLDAQSPVQVDAWVEFDSPRWKEVDDDPAMTKTLIHKLKGNYVTDTLGRVWGKFIDKDGYYPFHVERGGKKFGMRLSRLAAN